MYLFFVILNSHQTTILCGVNRSAWVFVFMAVCVRVVGPVMHEHELVRGEKHRSSWLHFIGWALYMANTMEQLSSGQRWCSMRSSYVLFGEWERVWYTLWINHWGKWMLNNSIGGIHSVRPKDRIVWNSVIQWILFMYKKKNVVKSWIICSFIWWLRCTAVGFGSCEE